MNFHQAILLVAVLLPLSLDTFVLTAALGLAGLPKQYRGRTSLVLAIFEGVMPAVGALVGSGIGHVVGSYAGYVAGAVIALTGVSLFGWGKGKNRESERAELLARTHGFTLINLGISVSIDELAIGAGLGLLHAPLVPVMILLGAQAFVAAQLGLWLGSHISARSRAVAEWTAGALLVLVGLAMIVSQMMGWKV